MRIAIAGFAVVLFAAGCCKSTQPLYTPDTLKQDIDLAGTWECYDPGLRKLEADNPFTVKRLSAGEFEVRWFERETWTIAAACGPRSV